MVTQCHGHGAKFVLVVLITRPLCWALSNGGGCKLDNDRKISALVSKGEQSCLPCMAEMIASMAVLYQKGPSCPKQP